MASTVALVNQKGGVGKTTVTLGLASAAWAAGHRVLVVDLDPQGSATWVLGVDPTEVDTSTAEVLLNGRAGSAGKAVITSGWGEEVDLVPASPRLAEREASGGPVRRLATALDGVASGYDAVLVDCAPSLGNLTHMGLAAAGHSLIVVEPSALGLRGIAAVADAIDEIWAGPNPELDLAGVVVNKVPAVSSEAERQYDELGHLVGKRAVWQPVVPQRVIVPQSAAERLPIHAMGWRAADVMEVFDRLWARLRRLVRKG
jgi:cellulose biosynthesis protein BcsQ